MSIGKRLAILVVVTLIALIGTGVYGLLQLRSLQSHFENVTERSVPSLIAMSNVSDQFKEARALLLALLMEEDDDLRKAFAQKVAETRAALKQATQDYAQVPGAKDSAQALDPIVDGYSQAIDAVLEVADKRDLAQLALYTKVIPAEQALSAFLGDSQKKLLDNQHTLQKQVTTANTRSFSIYVVVTLVTSIIVAILGFMLHRSVTGSLTEMTATMRNVASNLDFRQRLTVKSRDEVGATATAFNSLLDTVQASLREIAQSMDTLSSATSRLNNSTQEIRNISEQTSDSSSSVSATVQQVTVSIDHIATQTEQAEKLSRESGHQATAGGEVICSTIEQIRSIADTVDSAAVSISDLRNQIASISTVLNVIRDVAEQTNLLALNAAIEAARAGEHGRGFAVVADEVRKLAERTSSSTREIASLIQSIQESATNAVTTMQIVVERVGEGVNNASTANDALDSIRQGSDKVLLTVSEIATSIRQQSSASAHIADQFQRIANISEEARRTVADTTQSTQELEQLAIRLNDAVKRYRI
ncbi:putative Methyl-accepting chemotaxis protein [Sterolibacterium denitrificans]|uniref:Methyl-accepting chemotaxis protein n=1 Tax=Sterolibacterium denitrificans TaxID=157592 RepID=A0A7Z7HS79_9PROT|nr:methyl-accepting chemotaxis protein [Sterolibacterium denitrificans]SMB27287.1 putative Methyl-accepting chemotaxis protein [Sterolibacterium denitrificans]